MRREESLIFHILASADGKHARIVALQSLSNCRFNGFIVHEGVGYIRRERGSEVEILPRVDEQTLLIRVEVDLGGSSTTEFHKGLEIESHNVKLLSCNLFNSNEMTDQRRLFSSPGVPREERFPPKAGPPGISPYSMLYKAMKAPHLVDSKLSSH